MKTCSFLVFFLAFALSVGGGAAQKYTKAELRAQVIAFAEAELFKAGYTETDWHATVLNVTRLSPPTGTDAFVFLKTTLTTALQNTTPIFSVGGTDAAGSTHIVVVVPQNTSRVTEMATTLKLNPELELEVSGRFNADHRTPTPRSCYTIGRTCPCENKCKCVGVTTAYVCSCKKFIWWACDCPRKTSCSCGSGYYGGDYCTPRK